MALLAKERGNFAVVTFPTTTAALAMQKAAARRGLKGRLAPVPRQLSAGCGLAWREPADNQDALRCVIIEEEVEAEAVTVLNL